MASSAWRESLTLGGSGVRSVGVLSGVCVTDRDLLFFPREFLFGPSRLPSAWRFAGRGMGRDSVLAVASSYQAEEQKKRKVGGDG